MVIELVKPENSQSYVVEYKTQKDKENPRGYFTARQVESSFDELGNLRTTKRYKIFRGAVKDLEETLANTRYQLKGKLLIKEILESDLDANPRLKNDILPLELRKLSIEEYNDQELELYEQYLAKSGVVKKTADDGVELTKNGVRILRFVTYDITGEGFDSLISHDNTAEVQAWSAQRNARLANAESTASLPNQEAAPF
jgi:hypothetical protein